jgi:hypothetical protein
MAASDNLYVPTEEPAHTYASRKGIKTEKEREVEKATKGEEEYVPSKLELSSAILEEKVEEDSEESAHAKKKRGLTPYFFINLLLGGLNILVLSSFSRPYASSRCGAAGAACCSCCPEVGGVGATVERTRRSVQGTQAGQR